MGVYDNTSIATTLTCSTSPTPEFKLVAVISIELVVGFHCAEYVARGDPVDEIGVLAVTKTSGSPITGYVLTINSSDAWASTSKETPTVPDALIIALIAVTLSVVENLSLIHI